MRRLVRGQRRIDGRRRHGLRRRQLHDSARTWPKQPTEGSAQHQLGHDRRGIQRSVLLCHFRIAASVQQRRDGGALRDPDADVQRATCGHPECQVPAERRRQANGHAHRQAFDATLRQRRGGVQPLGHADLRLRQAVQPASSVWIAARRGDRRQDVAQAVQHLRSHPAGLWIQLRLGQRTVCLVLLAEQPVIRRRAEQFIDRLGDRSHGRRRHVRRRRSTTRQATIDAGTESARHVAGKEARRLLTLERRGVGRLIQDAIECVVGLAR